MSEEDSLEGLLDPPATSLLISTTLREKGRGVERRRELRESWPFQKGKIAGDTRSDPAGNSTKTRLDQRYSIQRPFASVWNLIQITPYLWNSRRITEPEVDLTQVDLNLCYLINSELYKPVRSFVDPQSFRAPRKSLLFLTSCKTTIIYIVIFPEKPTLLDTVYVNLPFLF
uniref:uncharacterized protein LOC117601228 isoform X1 n=1 Tax=Osmia lignaria TaxID=473952 RepID=UPI0014791C63|nr:uncharacterized protein LOC117601228 isoform X1 [Osmia lignaria]